jgi:hypothetical protein
MAKQTFTTGQVLTAAQMTDLQQTAMTGGAASTKTVSYVLVAADAGTRVAMNAAGSTTITVNTALFSAGDTVSIQNIGAGVCTVTAGTATVNTSGSLVLAQYQGGILYFTSASTAIFFQFATPASGDIEGVTAGTGISGGGTSGTVTITNSMATAIDAKGDLIVGTGADAFSRLAVGTNGQVLTADSGEATGLKFATPAASTPTFVGCTLNSSSFFTFSNNTNTAVALDAEVIDTDAFHSDVTNNSRITIPTGKGGKYLIQGQLTFDANATGKRRLQIFKNGSAYTTSTGPGVSSGATNVQCQVVLSLVATDYIQLYALQDSGGSLNASNNEAVLSAVFLGA